MADRDKIPLPGKEEKMTTSCEVYKEGKTWILDCGIDGQDGYKTRLDALYAMAIKLWGGPMLTPKQAASERPDGWIPLGAKSRLNK